MKKLVIFVGMLAIMGLSGSAFAQNSGLGFNYQAVIRNAYGFVLQDSAVTLKVSLYPGQQATTPTWVETHNVKTDNFGTIGIRVGHGTRDNASVAALFKDVNFAAVYYWLKIEIKEGNTFCLISYTSLPSAPYSDVAYNASVVPAGMIMAFGGDVAQIPNGWMLCDGRQLSRSEYANLFNAIGVAWGIGNNSTTFNIPDMRGVFLRGVSHNSGNDPDAETRVVLTNNGANSGNKVGSYQSDAIRNITGSFRQYLQNEQYDTSTGIFYKESTLSGIRKWGDDPATYAVVGFNASRQVPIGNDNRPKNVYVNYIIKF